MIPGCTHVLDIEIDDHSVDLLDATNVYVTLAQGSTLLTFTGEQIDIGASGYELSVGFTQEQSLQFRKGNAELQINWLMSDGDTGFYRYATDVIAVKWDKQLLRQVLPS